MEKILPRAFFKRDTVLIAKELLGKKVIRIINGKKLSGIIVETEAYIFDDPACHAHKGKTKANEALFGPVGHAYIYFIYGNHYCFNVVSHKKNQCAGGVLIRALEPVDGIKLMQKNRNALIEKNLTNGPGKLTQALHINKNQYSNDLTKKDELYIAEGIKVSKNQICTSPRIGISKSKEKELRFYLCDNEFVSKR